MVLLGAAATVAEAPARKEPKTTIKKQKFKAKSSKSSEDSKREREKEGKVSVSIRTSQGVPLKKLIDEDAKLKAAIEELLAIEGERQPAAALFVSLLCPLRLIVIVLSSLGVSLKSSAV